MGSGLDLRSVVHPQSKVLTLHLLLADMGAMTVLGKVWYPPDCMDCGQGAGMFSLGKSKKIFLNAT